MSPCRLLKAARKNVLLAEICPVCKTEAEVVASLAAAGFEGGIPPEYLTPITDLTALSFVAAIWLDCEKRLPELSADLLTGMRELRAHLLKHFDTNYHYYVVRGVENREDRGQNRVVSKANRYLNLLGAMHACFNHYANEHDAKYCGLLRKGRACVPFQVFARASPVSQFLFRRINHALVFLKRHRDEDLASLLATFPDQVALRHHFELD
jgi:hypothetical protein